MKTIKTLNLKEETDFFVDFHTSSIIDEKFIQKYCVKEDSAKLKKEVESGQTEPQKEENQGINLSELHTEEEDDSMSNPLLPSKRR